ncbi:MAG: protein of unknown function RIO1 [Candidatus Parvarchaeum acidophilus ARMAN-5]|jgi:TP53 regulating kinase-like protein|uniref:non-specific serine/threonine protein kinase n=1 Tax=Candidatus Parvarchaeum acidophilus ARMAN-5 TaxID=662762 RepID=D6GUI2_PARA5|nr:MAG: protein of unknown function RIO1 [Candidatus Parvarchaeum acidophilus ARMAN-5]
MKIIEIGSEATVFENKGIIIKRRNRKKYRIKEIDEKLRIRRTRSEFRIMERLYSAGIKVPQPLKLDEKNMQISMKKIDGKKLAENFKKEDAPIIGKLVAMMHNQGIIHGDLTTSNMIRNKDDIYLIDFGLSYSSKKDEDLASDLFLFKTALKSKHNEVSYEAFKAFISSYKTNIGKEFKGIDTHLKDIEERRRYNESY